MNHLLLILLIVSILFLLRRERNIEGQSVAPEVPAVPEGPATPGT